MVESRIDEASMADADASLGVAGGADDAPIMELVHRLHAGELAPEALTVAMRRQCVAHLTLEGFATSEIAELLRTSKRTVRRDREAERRAGAMQPSAALGDELLGEFERVMHASGQRLARLARDPATPAYARLWAEEAIVRNYQRFIQTAHRMHYIEEGTRRLAHERETDPAEQERYKQRMKAQMKTMRQLVGAV